jgi:hypothetical protein
VYCKLRLRNEHPQTEGGGERQSDRVPWPGLGKPRCCRWSACQTKIHYFAFHYKNDNTLRFFLHWTLEVGLRSAAAADSRVLQHLIRILKPSMQTSDLQGAPAERSSERRPAPDHPLATAVTWAQNGPGQPRAIAGTIPGRVPRMWTQAFDRSDCMNGWL